ncbi:MAG: OmpA family protein [Cytophagales bacterium]|nr:OmpA family protein [Cytophagales bacterium]
MNKITIIFIFFYLFINIKNFAQSKKSAEEAAKQYKLHIEKGIKNYQDENYYAAEQEFYKALKIKPSDADASHFFAESCRLNADYEDAEQSYEIVLKSPQAGKFPYDRYWLGMMQKLNGKYYEAAHNFDIFFKKLKPKNLQDRGYLKSAYNEQRGCQIAMDQLSKPIKDINLRVVPPPVNSRNTDFAPLIFGHDSMLVITSARADAKGKELNATTGEARCDNFRFEKIGDRWLKMGDDDNFHIVNTPKDDGAGHYTVNKQKYYYTICDPNCAIFVSKKEAGKFTKAQKLNDFINEPMVWNAQPTLNKTMDTMLFVSQRDGGKGYHDIWYSVNADKTGEKEDWQKPVNYTLINTDGIEISPFWDDSTGIIYFASNGQAGFGGLDIYQLSADRKTVQNMGMPYNSSRDDMYMVMGATKGYLVSNRQGGVGLTDILMFDRKPVIYQLTKVKKGLFKKGESVTAAGKVKFADFDENIEGAVIYMKDTTGKVIMTTKSGKDGSFMFENIPTDIDFVVSMDESDSRIDITLSFLVDQAKIETKVQKAGKKETSFAQNNDESMKKILKYEEEKIKGIAPQNIIGDGAMATQETQKKPVVNKDVRVVFENIYFDFNSKELLPSSKLILDDIYEYLKTQKNAKVEIKAYTDALGSANYNQALAEERGTACYEYLIAKGLDKEVLKIVPVGHNNAIGNNESFIGRQLNRRVEFSIQNADDEYLAKAMTYIVEPQMTLFSIAKKFSMTVDELKNLNGMQTNEIKAYTALRVKNVDNMAVIDPNTIMNMNSGQMEYLFSDNQFVPITSKAGFEAGIK